MKLTEMSQATLDFVKANGGKVTIDAIVEATGRTARSVSATVTDLKKKGLDVRETIEPKAEGEAKQTFVILTDEGMDFVPTEE